MNRPGSVRSGEARAGAVPGAPSGRDGLLRIRPFDIAAIAAIALAALMLAGGVTWRQQAIRADNEQLIDQRGSERALTIAAALRDTLAATMVQADTLHELGRLLTSARLRGDTAADLALRPELDKSAFLNSPGIVQVSGLDSHGRWLWSNGRWDAEGIDLSGRDYVRALLQNPAQVSFTGLPTVGRSSGVLSIHLARAIREADGTLRGITVVSVRAAMLQRLCQDFALAGDDVATLLRSDGVVLMRNDMAYLGQAFPGWVSGANQYQAGERVTPQVSRQDGTLRFVVERPIPGTDLIVRVAVSRASLAGALGWPHTGVWDTALIVDITAVGFAVAGSIAVVLRRRARLAAAYAASLADSEAWFRSLIDDVPYGVVVMDGIAEQTSRIDYANEAAHRLLGLEPGELAGRDWRDLVHPDDLAMVDRRLAAAAAGSPLKPGEYRVLHSDGRAIWLRLGSAVLPHPADVTRLRLIAMMQDVTEERARAEALTEARAGLDRIQKLVPGCFYELLAPPGGEFAVSFLSQSAAGLFGLPFGDIDRPDFLDSRAAVDLKSLRSDALCRLEASGIATIDYPVLIGEGRIWLRDTLRPIPRDDGWRQVVGYLADVTAEHAALDALRRRNWALGASTRSLAALIHSGSFDELVRRVCESIVDEPPYVLAMVGKPLDLPGKPVTLLAGAGASVGYLDGLDLSWDPSLTAGQGPTGLAVRGHGPQVMSDSLGDPSFAPWREKARAHGIRSSVTVPNATRDGEAVRAVLLVYASESGAFGADEVALFQRLADEIAFAMALEAERAQAKASETARLEAEENLAAAVQLGPGVLYRARVRDGGVQLVSVFGDPGRVTAGVSTGSDLASILSDPVALPGLLEAFEESRTSDFAVPAAAGGAHWLRNVVRVVARTGSETEVVGYLSEVTREKQEQFDRQQMATLLTLGEMATGMAHELNQPLSSISFAAQNIRLRMDTVPADLTMLRGKIAKIEAEAHRASRLVEHMRVFARNEREAPRPVAWQDVAQRATEILRPMLLGCDLSIDIPADLPPVTAAPIPLEQVLVNLIGNAVDAYEDSVPEAPRAIQVKGRVDDESVLVCVRDHAGGIPPAILPRLFEPFFTTKSPGKGTGLGLALAFGTITEYGGTIVARNEDDGAVFEVRLPRAADTNRNGS